MKRKRRQPKHDPKPRTGLIKIRHRRFVQQPAGRSSRAVKITPAQEPESMNPGT